MRTTFLMFVLGCVVTVVVVAQPPSPAALHPPEGILRVILLGSGGGPGPNSQRLGISTLVVAGNEKLMFDCGRAATLRMAQMGMLLGEVDKLFVTHPSLRSCDRHSRFVSDGVGVARSDSAAPRVGSAWGA